MLLIVVITMHFNVFFGITAAIKLIVVTMINYYDCDICSIFYPMELAVYFCIMFNFVLKKGCNVT
jgi:hypothetical protein